MSTFFIGLGSNIEAEENIIAAAENLKDVFPDIAFSSLYSSAPLYQEDQDEFLNAVCMAETEMSIEEVIEVLEQIEEDLGKKKESRYGPRTIDLDLLLFEDECVTLSKPVLSTDEASKGDTAFQIPHPKMHERRFVLEPLCELIDPEELHPVLRKSWGDLLAETMEQSCDLLQIEL